MTTKIRLTTVACVVALAGATFAEVLAPTAAYAERLGTVTEYSLPTSVSSMTTGPDGNLWAAGEGFIYRLTPAGVVTQFTPPSAPVTGIGNVIIAGADGNMWYLATGLKVGKMTTSGSFLAEYDVPPGNNVPNSIAAGADGNLWILYQRARASDPTPTVTRITPAGVVTPFVFDTASLASSIVAGPGGRLYWVARNAPAIKSIDPADPVGSFAVHTTFGGGFFMAPGSDGNVWFGQDAGAPMIGKMTPAGTITTYPVLINSGTSTVGLGPDGSIWFSGNYGDESRINRMSPDGTFKSFPVGSTFASARMPTAGPDGAVWFLSGSQIGRIAVGDTSTTVLNLASGFSDDHIRTPGPNSTVKFVFAGPTSATVTDTSGLDLFDSGVQTFVTAFPFNYYAAGSYTYADTLQPGHTGTVDVPPTVSTTYTYTGPGAFLLQWAADVPPEGFVYDVQRQIPGGVFEDYLMGTTAPNSTEQPFSPAGTYAYRARLHRVSDDAVSGWSPEVRVRFGTGAPAAFAGFGTQRSVFRPESGAWYVDDGGPSTAFFGLSDFVPVPADFNGDGATDRAVYRPDVGAWYVDDGGPSTFFFGLPGDLPVPADYNGDGIDDRAVFRPSEGAWYTDDGGPTITFFGLPGDVPVPADYDDDGKIDRAVFRPSAGAWYVLRSSDSVVAVTSFGLTSDIPVPGDYDGDGRWDEAVYRPATGTWFIRPSGAPNVVINYGLSGDIPVPGDYDADSKTDVAVFRHTTSGQWFIHPSGGGPDTISDFGFASDIPLPLPAAIRLLFFP